MPSQKIAPGTLFVPSPLGTVRVVAHDGAVTALDFFDDRETDKDDLVKDPKTVAVSEGTGKSDAAFLLECHRQLTAYFLGAVRELNLPVRPVGTPFQQTVWDALKTIPVGEQRTYADMARLIGDTDGKKTRAVGQAIGKNPVSILIPCHRVVGQGGKLTGYAWGLPRKKWLIRHEAYFTAPMFRWHLMSGQGPLEKTTSTMHWGFATT
jgi:O-6-methylguanine DNA methyltransferase